eukprot:g2272.t1
MSDETSNSATFSDDLDARIAKIEQMFANSSDDTGEETTSEITATDMTATDLTTSVGNDEGQRTTANENENNEESKDATVQGSDADQEAAAEALIAQYEAESNAIDAASLDLDERLAKINEMLKDDTVDLASTVDAIQTSEAETPLKGTESAILNGTPTTKGDVQVDQEDAPVAPPLPLMSVTSEKVDTPITERVNDLLRSSRALLTEKTDSEADMQSGTAIDMETALDMETAIDMETETVEASSIHTYDVETVTAEKEKSSIKKTTSANTQQLLPNVDQLLSHLNSVPDNTEDATISGTSSIGMENVINGISTTGISTDGTNNISLAGSSSNVSYTMNTVGEVSETSGHNAWSSVNRLLRQHGFSPVPMTAVMVEDSVAPGGRGTRWIPEASSFFTLLEQILIEHAERGKAVQDLILNADVRTAKNDKV